MRRYPLPGMRAAREVGCPCENNNGVIRWIAACPVHGVLAPTSDTDDATRDPGPHRFSEALP